MTDALLTLFLLLGLVVPLFLLVIWKNGHGGRMYSRRMDTETERQKFMDDWGPEERRPPERDADPDPDEDSATSSTGASPERGRMNRMEHMDGMDFVARMRQLRGHLEAGKITREEFDRISRKLTWQAWDEKGKEGSEE
ncbi:MAG: hypothetical protein AB7E32_11860 [Desulfovibrio sp.]